ncbi:MULTISPECIES: YlaI family protein [unclassified Staphylococcus]|uniref:YlaI family protein n=1 Tax=unclassified Staphylococcus TaxID=91994 RepID=UPI0021CE2095|nr:MULTISPECIES: YlaI family protein [unclassified Staphylococcus]UXR78977.1 YlaI family protein [Staphylococcus sp. IVB6227]UXR83137.1 YlaI family protein [Staphylococcus sp. IVB6214]
MRKVTCVICDTEVLLDENTLLSKRLKNNPIRTFMCDECKSRLDTPRQRPAQSLSTEKSHDA